MTRKPTSPSHPFTPTAATTPSSAITAEETRLIRPRTSPLFDVVLPLVFGGAFVFACTASVPGTPNDAAPPDTAAVVRVQAPVVDAGEMDVIASAAMDADAFDVTGDTMSDRMRHEPIATLFDREALPTKDDDKRTVDEHLKDADLARAAKNMDEAIRLTRHALAQDSSGPIWAKLGDLYTADRKDERAIDCYEEALAQDGALHDARISLTRLYIDSENGEEAGFHAQKLVTARPAEGRYLLGRSFMTRSMWREAVEELTQVAQDEPNNPYVQNNLGYSALQIGANDIAVDHLEAILSAKAKRPYMMNNLGLAYERTGRMVEALASYQHAIDMRARYTRAIVNRDRVLPQLTADEVALAEEIRDDYKTPVVAESEDVLAQALSDGESLPAD